MKLKCLGSGSSGNCYILENKDETLIIEAGVPYKEVKVALGFNVRKIVGVIALHCHLDHAGYLKDYEGTGITIIKPYEKYVSNIQLGGFNIQFFDLVHDVMCYGALIKHKDMGKLLYASDTSYIKYRFKGLNHILIEANYDKRMLSERGLESAQRNHVLTGHMELQTALEFLRVNKSFELQNVILCHLSEYNADPIKFFGEARKVVNCPATVARKGLEIDISLPF